MRRFLKLNTSSAANATNVTHTPDTAPLALLGGTFDPVHWGHLRIATETAAALRLPEVRLLPAKVPVHRPAPGATSEQRLEMLRLAVLGQTGLSVDDRELCRESASYAAITLASLRAEFPLRPLIWLIGVDAFLHINQWYQWPRLFDLAHFVVLNRPGFAVSQVLSPSLSEVWAGRLTRSAEPLRESTHGCIFLHTVTPQSISATDIRRDIARGATDSELSRALPASVLAYIRTHQLYRSSPAPTQATGS
jgi:nicotinate-nucleotide adenylyltransferase